MKERTKKMIIDLVIVAAIVLAVAAFVIVSTMAENIGKDLPPSPLQVQSYKRTDDMSETRRIYDCTTGHTWWVVSVNGHYVVLDTAGTTAIG